MRFDYLHHHIHQHQLSRREALGLGGKAGAAAALGSLGLGSLAGVAGASEADSGGPAVARTGDLAPEPINDEMFDPQAVIAGAWAPGPYGPGDQRGALNEITPFRTAAALRLIDQTKPVTTYNLGDLLRNGFPAYPSVPPRLYEQRLTQSGYEPPPDFEGFRGSSEPAGPNLISGHEERFPEGGTYQIATQLDNLNHVGVGPMFYNGYTGPDIAETWGTSALGNENMGPIITRGVILDVLGLKQEQGATDAYFTLEGHAILNGDYRITVEDIEGAMRRGKIPSIHPGDVVLFRTGWHRLADLDPERYLAEEPGIYLREARYLAQFRPAIIGGDAWALETLNPDVTQGNAFPVHQLLLGRYGIRIGEGMITDALVRDGITKFVFIVTPQMARGATAGNTPPAGLAQPQRQAPPTGPVPLDDGAPQPQQR